MKPDAGKDSPGSPSRPAERSPAKPPAEVSPSAEEAPRGTKEEGLVQRVKALEGERDRLKTELAEARDRFLRARADYENLVRRSQKDSLESVRGAKGSLLLRLTALAESLARAAAQADPAGPDAGKGVRLVHEEALRLLRDEGVREIETVGHQFNHRFHEAVEQTETSDTPEGTVLGVIQPGYLYGGDVLRPALVRVAAPPRKPAGHREAAVGPA